MRATRNHRYFPLLLVLGALFLASQYWPGFPEEVYVIDDRSLLDIPLLRSTWNIAWWKTLLTPGLHIDFYPLRDLSYWIDFHLFGASVTLADGIIFRLQNLAWLTLAAYLVYRLLEEFFRDRRLSALLATTWLVHPFHSETFMWASARKDAMSIAFFCAFLLALFRGKNRAVVGNHFVGLLSKSSALLAPYAVLTSDFLDRTVNGPKRRGFLFLAATVSALSAAIQLALYSHDNDMRFSYTWDYRIQAAAAAFGRGIVGIFDYRVSGVDVENWGDWLLLNREFTLFGALVLVVLLGFTLSTLYRSIRTGTPDPTNRLFWLGLFWATYLPISGLVFSHRNFYSVRYFELPFLVLFLWGAQRVSRSQRREWLTYGGTAVLLLVALTTHFESKNWHTGLAFLEKGLARDPVHVALNRLALNHLDNEARWGRLGPKEIERRRDIVDTLKSRCGPRASDDRFENGHLCQWVWYEELFVRKRLGLENVAPGLIESSLSRVAPATAARIRTRLRNPDGDWPEGRVATVDQRIAQVRRICKNSGDAESQKQTETWIRSHLLDRQAIVASLDADGEFKSLHCFYSQK